MDHTFDAASTFPESVDHGAAPAAPEPTEVPSAYLVTFPAAAIKAIAAWTDADHPVQSLVRFEGRRVIATDGSRLAIVDYSCDGRPGVGTWLGPAAEVPSAVLLAASRHAGPKGTIAVDPVRLEITATPAAKRGAAAPTGAVFSWRKSDYTFPPWRQVVPDFAWGPSPTSDEIRDDKHRHRASLHAVHPRLLAGMADVVEAIAGHLPRSNQGVCLRGCASAFDAIVYTYDDAKASARATFVIMPMINREREAASGKKGRR